MVDTKHTILVFGLHHKRAPIQVRECLAFEEKDIPKTLTEIIHLPKIAEVAMLSTCNRVELYITTSEPEKALASLQSYLSHSKNVPSESFMPYSFLMTGQEAILHLFRVAAGIDSLVLGEDQILGQVKTALRQAIHVKTAGRHVHKVFQMALSTGKAVRSETGIASRDVSLARAAFDFSLAHHPHLLKQRIAVLGGGKMAEIILQCLSEHSDVDVMMPLSVLVANRTEDKATHLAETYGFTAISRAELMAQFENVDVLFVATASPHYILHAADFMAKKGKTIIFDISVPRNVEPETGSLPEVTLYNTDDLAGYSGYSNENRDNLLAQAEVIISREYKNYEEWRNSRLAAPFIMMLREQFELIRQRELESLLIQNPQLEQLQGKETIEILEKLSRQLLNKLLHYPIMQLKRMANDGNLSSNEMAVYMKQAMSEALEKTRQASPEKWVPYQLPTSSKTSNTVERYEEETIEAIPDNIIPFSRSI